VLELHWSPTQAEREMTLLVPDGFATNWLYEVRAALGGMQLFV